MIREKIEERLKKSLCCQILKKNYGFIILWILFVAILYWGLNDVLFFMSDPSKSEMGIFLSACLVSFGMYLLFEQRKKFRFLMSAWHMLNIYNKNIFYSLDFKGHHGKHEDMAKYVIRQKVIEYSNLNDVSNFTEIARYYWERDRLFYKVDELRSLYDDLCKLDQIIISFIERNIRSELSEGIYVDNNDFYYKSRQLRWDLLLRFSEASLNRQFLYFKDTDKLDGILWISRNKKLEKAIIEFYKMILNEFYKDYENYKQQPVNFNLSEFEEYFYKKINEP